MYCVISINIVFFKKGLYNYFRNKSASKLLKCNCYDYNSNWKKKNTNCFSFVEFLGQFVSKLVEQVAPNLLSGKSYATLILLYSTHTQQPPLDFTPMLGIWNAQTTTNIYMANLNVGLMIPLVKKSNWITKTEILNK